MRKVMQAGFTLIELVVVIVILGILAAVAVPQFTDLTGQAKQAVGEAACGALQSSAVLLFASTKSANTIGNIIGNTTTTGGTFSGSCSAPVFTNSDGTTTTTCAAIPSPGLCN
jgi:prepilin-type N-terminal cleavage/methylation domain-containing protein